MKRTLSTKKIIEDYDKFENSLTVLTFTHDGKRLSTYGGLNIFQAFKEMSVKFNPDVVIVVCKNIPTGVGLSNDIKDYLPYRLTHKDFDYNYGYKSRQ